MASDQNLFHYSLLSLFLAGPPTIIALRYLQAPYGKHNRPGWGPTISPPLAWFLMESPTLWLTLLLFPLGQHHSNPKAQILISPFLLHYLHRTCLYPLRLHFKTHQRKTTSGFPITVALMAFAFNLWNAYLQARWVSQYAEYENDMWFWWRFCGGLAIFISGMVVNVRSDMALLALKGEGGGGYKIPRGGWFELVSCPNYFGEIVEWMGWALMTWSWAGLGFVLYTCANLVPRAQGHHRWYLEKFGEDYPRATTEREKPTSDILLSPSLMATTHPAYTTQNSSQRGVAMALALASAVVLSPLYVKRRNETRYETRWNSGFVLPMVLAGLIIAIKTTSSSSSSSLSMQRQRGDRATLTESSDTSWVLRIGSSSWGLAGVLVMLMLVLSWQDSVHHFFWR